MPTVTLVVMGVSGSGKTTVAQRVAQRLGWVFAEGDDFHSPANVAKMRAGHPLTDEDRWPWLRTLADWIGAREAAAEDAVLTCSALKRAYRDVLADGHPSVRFVHVTASDDTIRRRLEHRRGHYMPASLLTSQLAALEPLQPDEPGLTLPGDGDPDDVVSDLVARLEG
ncbi:MAG: gluconokinase [Actinomycetota bacterium]|nr:gluconokinase [Actinomycetota bacterium]